MWNWYQIAWTLRAKGSCQRAIWKLGGESGGSIDVPRGSAD